MKAQPQQAQLQQVQLEQVQALQALTAGLKVLGMATEGAPLALKPRQHFFAQADEAVGSRRSRTAINRNWESPVGSVPQRLCNFLQVT